MNQEHKEFQPRFRNPSEQDVDEALWCVRTNEPWSCAHDPECRDVFYAEVIRQRSEIAGYEEKQRLCKIKEDCYDAALVRASGKENALEKALRRLLNYAINTARCEIGQGSEDEIESIKNAKQLIGGKGTCSCLPAMGTMPPLQCRNCYNAAISRAEVK